MLNNFLRLIKIPVALQGQPYIRQEACSICSETRGLKIGAVDFWDLQEANLIKCTNCRHIQLDPKLTPEHTETGCNAYYSYENQNSSGHEKERNLVRNYRRGILFGYKLKKKGFSPQDLLELGPGSGYFSLGIQHLFPNCKITVMDVVEQVLEKNQRDHHFSTLKGKIEDCRLLGEQKFDLIIARDILEHINDISLAIENISFLLKKGGLLHFLTPNGHEDVWGHYLFWRRTGTPSELLINHVNYFDGQGLLDLLKKYQLLPVKYFTFQFKTTLRGKGWSRKERLEAIKSRKQSASVILSTSLSAVSGSDDKEWNIPKQWYFRQTFHRIGIFLSWYHHRVIFKLPPRYNMGHEIHGIFIKN